jgi:hypothetical protein
MAASRTTLAHYAHDVVASDDDELAADLHDAASRLEFIRDSDEDVEDRIAAWEIVEEAIDDAEARALARLIRDEG